MDESPYTLHVFPFSLYSLMVRYTIALGRRATGWPGASPKIQLKLVNLHRDENLSQEYLLEINPKGQVPSMTGGRLQTPITDSLDISRFLVEEYFSALMPEEHSVTIERLLGQLHSIQGLSVSVAEVPEELNVYNSNEGLERLLAREDVVSDYRQALETKKTFHDSTLAIALRPKNVDMACEQGRRLLENVRLLWQGQKSLYLFGDDIGPTLLDAHVVPFLIRLLDVNSPLKVPQDLLLYVNRLRSGEAWMEVTHGRSSVWDVSVGHVHLLKDL